MVGPVINSAPNKLRKDDETTIYSLDYNYNTSWYSMQENIYSYNKIDGNMLCLANTNTNKHKNSQNND